MSKKRSNGEGTFLRRDNGNWTVQVMVGYKSDGSREIKSFTGKTQKEARQKRDDYLQKRESGMLLGEDMTFNEWSLKWFDNHKDNITPTTQENYRYTLRILQGYFGNRKVSDIKTYDIEQFLRKIRREGRSDSSVAQCRGMLFQIFKKAAANDLIHKNPVEFADKMRKGPPKRKDAFTTEEVRILFEKLPDDAMGWSIRLMLATGMRTQELLGLEPRHIAKDGSWINIEQAVVVAKGTATIGTPKSYDSYRTIPVPMIARECAVNLRSTQHKFIWEVGKKDMPCNPTYFRKKFKQALEEIEGVRVLTPHSCRHTYVSQMQALGVAIETIQSLVGHADIDMTKHYLHVQEPIRQEAIDRFDQAFSNRHGGVFGNVLQYTKTS